MKKIIAIIVLAVLLNNTSLAYAAPGANGYEGGISSGEVEGIQTYDYQEVVFITGEPVVYSGQLVIVRSARTDTETTTYRYNLTSGENNRLTRTIVLDTKVEEKNNQWVRKSVLRSRPVERITIGDITYTLDALSNVDFSMSSITDKRPACDYFAGNWNGKKTYSNGNGQFITVTTTGKTYGYDQHWGSAEVQEISIGIESTSQSETVPDHWAGRVDIKISSSNSKQLIYMDNRPEEISFEGGYLQRQGNNSILQYTAYLPEFDSDGISTDRMIKYKDELSLQSFPRQERLPVPDLKKIKGHWYEKDVKELYSLEVLDDKDFMPNQYMTRAEFAKAVVKAAKMPIEGEDTNTRTVRGRNNQKEQKVSPFADVPVDHPYYPYIYTLYTNGTMTGIGDKNFNPYGIINRVEALTIFIRMLGFEGIAPNPTAVTLFRDNDIIPAWGRNSVAVASHIGLVKGDDYGYLNPNQPMTKAEAAAFLNRFIGYMRYDIIRDYRDRVMIY